MTYQACFSVPHTTLGIRCNEDTVTEILFLPHSTPASAPTNALAEKVCQALDRYFNDPTTQFDLPLAIRGTPFQQRVWAAIAAVPAGETITYRELAERVGSGPRAVANACGANHFPIVIPCHRIVATNGLGGFMSGRKSDSLDIKRWLLAHERNAASAA
ncbi:methylated-DNA-[protein]-cysteine S-methyltransferase [Novimethylophilus kurashikiensis]|uniref:methylated-DNA--[protein]-cysteine S-methyltransferase n=1 Tax=Novimethylophilus kurashikiensis TaxID=1825523 RepID=A0A2R5F540_9PROT|nr:methylated-DNA--[protein]-cysteine S-methyltransferase [Novimethylophilus kurashikiensis]GBG13482.1 methylated-DNA-[protein]-cysteine S-methyltransferase [Novimethylophilus kurashikiensis]